MLANVRRAAVHYKGRSNHIVILATTYSGYHTTRMHAGHVQILRVAGRPHTPAVRLRAHADGIVKLDVRTAKK